ncbi:hypothetical protein GYB22_08890 [bacterium]|nr:hypothetical protein [bacterium]
MNLLRNTLTIAIALFLFSGTTTAQYGRSWINPTQKYYRMDIGAEGLYRLDYATLVDIGVPVASIDPHNFQIFQNGTEQYIFVQGEGDNTFDPGDYIEFYGNMNDGSLDTPMYPDPNDQPHTYSSLYTDSAVYWLTWSNTPGLRTQSFYDGNYSGKTADPWILYESILHFRNEHYDGAPFFSPGYHSEYTKGEGWFSGYFAGNVNRRLDVNTEQYNSSGPIPSYEASVYSKSNPVAIDGNGYNHEVQIRIGDSVIFRERHRNYGEVLAQGTLVPSLIGANNTRFEFSSILLERGRHAVSYITLTYPRNLNLLNRGTFTWNYTGGNSYFRFSNYGSSFSDPIIYDLTNHERIKGDISSNTLEFNTSGTSARKLYILDGSKVTSISASSIKQVNFNPLDASTTDYDYLIITHPSLQNSADQYKQYRESAAGGAYKVLVVYSTDLYNEYYYGVHHAMAIRNFCKYIYDTQANPPEYLLLLGKGQVYSNITKDPIRRNYEDLVPTWGIPPSDYMFVTDYTKNDLAPAMAVGRIPARKDNEVINYLEKLKIHETFGNKSKIMLQLTGGSDQTEAQLLQSHQESYYNIAKGEKLGMSRVEFKKNQSVLISTSLVDEIQGVINDGVHTLSYFGHGASQVLEVDIGDPGRLKNKGNYPLFVFNGCALGHSFSESSLPEVFLLQEDDGAVAWVASSAFGYINDLSKWSFTFYNNLYRDMYGEPIGKVIQNTIDEYQLPNNNFNRAQCRQMLFHGDPAVRLYAPDKPDYEVQNPITVYPEDVNAENDSFALVLDVANYGLALTKDTPNLHIVVDYPNDSIHTFGPREYRPVYSKEKIYFWIPMTPYSAGLLKFTIRVDEGDSIPELGPMGEMNNLKTFEFFMPSNSIFPLFPPKDAIVPQPEVELVVQNYNVLAEEQEFIFEIDTTPLFNSPALQNSGVVRGSNIIKHTFLLPPFDSTDFFWRAKFNKSVDEGGVWETSTFAFIYGSPEGWSQGYYSKYLESEQDRMSVDTSNRTLVFNKTISNKYGLYAAGKNLGPTYRGIRVEPAYYYPGFLSNGIGAIAVNPNNQSRWMDSSKYNKYVPSNNWGINKKYYWPGSRSGAYWFDMRKQEDRDSFVHYMNNIPDDYYIFLFTGGNSGNELWEDTVYKAFELFGAVDIQDVENGHPYALMGRKGWLPGEATELTANENYILEPEDQFIDFATPIYPLASSGSMRSQKIGPSKSWVQFYRVARPKDTPKDTLKYDIIGVRADESEYVLREGVDSASIDLSFINAEEFPYLKVRANFKDEAEFSPMQQDRWTVLYQGVPEGSLQPDIAYSLNNDTLQEGDSLRVKIAFQNISDFNMDSVLVFSYNQDYYGNTDTIDWSYYPALDMGDHFIIDYSVDTRGNPLSNRFSISVNHNMDQLEQSLQNNLMSVRYHVNRDNKNPLLDVVFDGVHILDRDIVSPSPLITMTVLDENEFIYIQDPASFTVKLIHPDGTEEDITDNLDEVTFIPASAPGEKAVLEYHPKDLASGIYELQVSVSDASGNESSDLEYMIHFEVIREATITNFYPYPNPFTSSMKFVYTLTGEELPDYVKVTIMTVSGKVVREVTQSELGMMRIGNNVSEFTWDGTDEFGDPLANGVYLFKVTAKLNGEDLAHRASEGDLYFNNGYGKIYLMR